MKMAGDEYHYHEAVLRDMEPEILGNIATLQILTYLRNSISSEDAEQIERSCDRRGNIDGNRELMKVLKMWYPDAFIKFVESVWKTGRKTLARQIYSRVPDKFKKNLDYIFEDNNPDSPPTYSIPGNHGDHRGSQQDLDDSGVNQLSQQGSGAVNSAAVFQSGSPLRHSGSCIDNTQCPLLPSNFFPVQNSSVDVTENARGDNYHQSMRSQSTPQINLNVMSPPAKPFQSHTMSVPVTPSEDGSFTDNTAVGMRMLSDVSKRDVVKLSEILEENGDWNELIPDETPWGDVRRIKDNKHPFQELFDVFVRDEWNLQMFMEHAEKTLDQQMYNDVCRILRWNPPLLGAVGGMDEEPKILNTVQSRYLPNNASPGRGMLSGSPSELGSRSSADERSSGPVVWSPSQRQNNQRQSSNIHTAVGSSPELGSYADPSLLSESRGSVLRGVQTQSDPDGQHAEKSPGMDADQFSKDISAHRLVSEYSQLSSAEVPIDGVSSVREEKASVQPESDTEGHQAEKGPGLEAERFRKDISASRESTSREAESVPVPSVEDEEGFQAEKNPDLEAFRLREDLRTVEFRNIQLETESTQSIGQRSATGHRGTRSSATMTTTGSAVTTALHHPPSDAQTSTTADCEVTTVSSLPRTAVLSSTAASYEAPTAMHFQPAGIQSSANLTNNPAQINSEGASLGIGEHQPPLETQTSWADSLSSTMTSKNESG